MKKTTVKRKLDKLVSEIVRRKGYCVKCGRTANIQAAHIVSRANMAVRWDLENIIPLCPNCHINFAHKNPLLFAEFIKEYLGQLRYEALKQRARAIRKWTAEEMESYYHTLTEIEKGKDIEISMRLHLDTER